MLLLIRARLIEEHKAEGFKGVKGGVGGTPPIGKETLKKSGIRKATGLGPKRARREGCRIRSRKVGSPVVDAGSNHEGLEQRQRGHRNSGGVKAGNQLVRCDASREVDAKGGALQHDITLREQDSVRGKKTADLEEGHAGRSGRDNIFNKDPSFFTLNAFWLKEGCRSHFRAIEQIGDLFVSGRKFGKDLLTKLRGKKERKKKKEGKKEGKKKKEEMIFKKKEEEEDERVQT